MDVLYFAYGSNLCFRRLRARVPGVRALGPALLRGHELRWHKRGTDGSGKCSIVNVGGDAIVHGALYAILKTEESALDRAEGSGYNDILVSVESTQGDVTAKTYVAVESAIDDTRQPYSWYKALVVSGAESLGLPHTYVEMLRGWMPSTIPMPSAYGGTGPSCLAAGRANIRVEVGGAGSGKRRVQRGLSMAYYLVEAAAKEERLPELEERLEKEEFLSIRPFGVSVTFSLRGARRRPDGQVVWEEEDYCSPPLAQERAAVLDEYFDNLRVTSVQKNEGWAQIRDLPPLFPELTD